MTEIGTDVNNISITLMEGNESIGIGGLSKDRATKQHYCYYTKPNTSKRNKQVFSVNVDKAVEQYEAFKESLTSQKTVSILKPKDVKSLGAHLRITPSEKINKFFKKVGFNNQNISDFIGELFNSECSDGPFVAVNAAAIPHELIESALFGHEKGAFTGAHQVHTGFCEQADGGTLFLDEICEMDYGVQAKLLRFLQDHIVQKVGSKSSRTVD